MQLPFSIVYFTDDYYKELEKGKTKDGKSYLSLVATGRGVRGFKHLLETLAIKDSKAKTVFTNRETCKENGNWYINLDEYKKSVSSQFFSLYRETGLDGSLNYLSQKMPMHFTYDKTRLTDSDMRKISKHLPEVFTKITTREHKSEMISRTSQIVTDLGKKRKKLKAEIEDLTTIKNSSNIASIISSLGELDERLTNGKAYFETKGTNSWQSWLKSHSWIFGVLYNEPFEKQRVGFGNIPDFLFPTIDGFIDLYEIKLPTEEVIIADSSHSGSFAWSSTANRAISQCVNYLHEIELHQLELAKRIGDAYNIEVNFLKPRAFVVIGSDSKLDTNSKKEALKRLNYSLHGIEVITYDDLKRRGKQMLKIYGYPPSTIN